MNLGHSATGLAALTIVLACAGRAQEPHAAGRQDAGRNFMPAKRLTAAQKLQLVQDTLKIRPSKLAEIAALSIRTPYLPGTARLSFTAVDLYTTQQDYAELGRYATAMVYFKVMKAGRPHLVSFYIASPARQSLSVLASKSDYTETYLTQDRRVPLGSSVLSCVFTPTSTGECLVTLHGRDNGYTVSRIEVDVMS